MFNISRLETRFQEIVFLLTVMLALTVAIGGVFYLFLNPENFLSVTGATGGNLVKEGISNFGYTYFLFTLFILHIGHMILGHAYLLGDVIRMRWIFLKSFAIYFTILILISSCLTVLESYSGSEFAHKMLFGDGGWFGVVVGGFLFRNFGLMGAMVILFSILSVIGIAAGFMEIVNSFYVMKDIIGELIEKISISGPEKLKNIGQSLVDFVDQPSAQYSTATAGAGTHINRSLPLNRYHRGRVATEHYHIFARDNKVTSQEQIRLERPGLTETETLVQEETPSPLGTSTLPEEFVQQMIEEVKEENKTAAKSKTRAKKATKQDKDSNKKTTRKVSKKDADAATEEAEDIEGEQSEASAEVKVEIKPYRKRYARVETSILNKPEKRKKKTEKQMAETVAMVEERLESFGIKGKILKAHQGVTLTMFEFQPSAGVKLSKIQALGDDLALVLGAKSIRILTPIPGKSTVGFEIPNQEINMLRFSELVPEMLKKKTMELPVVLGMDVYNKVQIADLSKMPHLLVSGTTGSGKSVFTNNIISGLIAHISPKKLRFLMIDPKMIELSPYNGIPHLLKPVVTDVDEAKDLLLWAEAEMDKRYQIFSDMSVKSITTFNAAIKKGSKRAVEGRIGRKIDWDFVEMPYIVVIIDELADLMLTQGKEVERPITRIAQKARAAGIHMVLATQRPSSDIVTGLIKTNFPTRVSFKVSSGIDSRTILDSSGAEKLLGNGDMLYMAQGKAIERLQGSFISEDEVKKIVTQVTKQK